MRSASSVDSVVTLDRFASGKTFQEYLESGIGNREQFEQNYRELVIDEAHTADLQAIAARPRAPFRVLILGEFGSPDVYRGLPIAVRIAEAIGIESRIFERDRNQDIMAEFLWQGQFESMPVFAFYDRDHRYLCHFTERPQLAHYQFPMVREVMGDTSVEGIAATLGHDPSAEELKAARAQARGRYKEWQRTSDTWAAWRIATVNEVVDLLKRATA